MEGNVIFAHHSLTKSANMRALLTEWPATVAAVPLDWLIAAFGAAPGRNSFQLSGFKGRRALLLLLACHVVITLELEPCTLLAKSRKLSTGVGAALPLEHYCILTHTIVYLLKTLCAGAKGAPRRAHHNAAVGNTSPRAMLRQPEAKIATNECNSARKHDFVT